MANRNDEHELGKRAAEAIARENTGNKAMTRAVIFGRCVQVTLRPKPGSAGHRSQQKK